MNEYLYRISLSFTWEFKGNVRAPVYVVAENKDSAKLYAKRFLKTGCTVKTVTCLGTQLSGKMFSGSTKG
jgi:hypothetical protein